MKKIFLYFLRHILFFFVVCEFTVVSVFTAITYIEESKYYFSEFHPNSIVVFLYYLVQVPQLVLTFMPFSVLIAFIATLLTMNRAGEIIAMRANGLSVRNIVGQFLIISVFFAGFHFALDSFLIEKSAQKLSYIKNTLIEKKKTTHTENETHWIKNHENIFHFSKYNKKEEKFSKTEYFYFSPKSLKLKRKIQSQYAYFDLEIKKWILKNNFITEYADKGNKITKKESFVSDLPYGKDLIGNFTAPETQNVVQIIESIQSKSHTGQNTAEFYYVLNTKLTSLMIYLVFVLISIPFIFHNERSIENLKNISVSFAIAIFYWFGGPILKSVAIAKDYGKIIGPWIILILIALVALKRASKYAKEF